MKVGRVAIAWMLSGLVVGIAVATLVNSYAVTSSVTINPNIPFQLTLLDVGSGGCSSTGPAPIFSYSRLNGLQGWYHFCVANTGANTFYYGASGSSFSFNTNGGANPNNSGISENDQTCYNGNRAILSIASGSTVMIVAVEGSTVVSPCQVSLQAQIFFGGNSHFGSGTYQWTDQIQVFNDTTLNFPVASSTYTVTAQVSA